MTRLKISEIATEKGYKQRHLQMATGITPSTLNRYWNNRIKSVDLEMLDKIAKFLEVRPLALLDDSEAA